MYQKERIHLIYSTLKMKQFLSSQEIMSLCNTSRDTARWKKKAMLHVIVEELP